MPPVSPTSPAALLTACPHRRPHPRITRRRHRPVISTRPKRTNARTPGACLSGVDCPAGRRRHTIPTVGARGGGRKGQVRFPAVGRTEICVRVYPIFLLSAMLGHEAPSCLSRSQPEGNTGRHVLPRGCDTARGQILYVCFFSLFSARARSRAEKPDGRRNEGGNCTEPDRVRGTTFCRVEVARGCRHRAWNGSR